MGPFTFLGPRGVGYWHAFVFDPSLGADGRLYVGDWYGTGIFVSQDGGETFAAGAGVEFPLSYIVSIAAHPTEPLVALAVAGFADGTTDGANGDGAPISTRGEVFRTNDGGASWEALGSPAEGALMDLAVSPSDPEIVLVADAANIWRSIDGGDSFTLVTAAAGGSLVFSRTGDGVVLAAGERIWRSDDDGETWAQTDAPSAFYADVVASPGQDAFFAFGLTEFGGALAQAIGTDGALWEDVADPTYPGAVFRRRARRGDADRRRPRRRRHPDLRR